MPANGEVWRQKLDRQGPVTGVCLIFLGAGVGVDVTIRSVWARRAELVIVGAALLAAWVGLTEFLQIRFFVGAGDAAFMVSLIKSAAAGNGLVDPNISSANDVLPILAAVAETYCSSDFIPKFRNTSLLVWHAYWMTFPMALLTWLPGVTSLGITASLVALSHVGGLAVLWWFLRRKAVPLAIVLAFCVAVFVFKPWSESLIGQVYFDRLFILPGIALVLLTYLRLDGERIPLVYILGLALVCALISERPALMIAAFLIGYPVLRKGWNIRHSRDCLILMSAGLVCFVYFIAYTKLIQDSPYLQNWADLNGIKANLSQALLPGGTMYPQTMKLLAVLAPFLLLALFDWRMCLIAIGSVLPNIAVTVGGAEKYVFVTHYHMPYLPFVLAAAAIGLWRLWSLIQLRVPIGSGRYAAAALVTIAVAGIGIYSNKINASELGRTFAFDASVDPALVRALVPGVSNPGTAGPKAMQNFTRELVSGIPFGSTVSAPEALWPALVDRGNITIDFMPFGIGPDSHAILLYARQPDATYKLMIISFQTEAEIEKKRACVQQRVDSQYVQAKAAEFGGLRYVVYTKR